MSDSSALRFVSVGTSEIARRAVQAAMCSDKLVYWGAYSRDLERAHTFASEFGAAHAYDSFEAIANDSEVDAVYLARPNSLHVGDASYFLRAHKHVLLEKPACTSASDWEALLKLANEQGVILMEAMRSLHVPAHNILKHKIAQLGSIKHVEISMAKVSSRMARLNAGIMTNAFNPLMAGGALNDIGVYPIAQLVGLFDAHFTLAYAHASYKEVGDLLALKNTDDIADELRFIDLHGHASFIGKNIDGSEFEALVSWGKDYDSSALCEVAGEKGTVVWSECSGPENIVYHPHVEGAMVFTKADRIDEPEAIDAHVLEHDMQAEFEHFADAVVGTYDLTFSHYVSSETQRLMDEIRAYTFKNRDSSDQQ